jgi:hypothetical protein
MFNDPGSARPNVGIGFVGVNPNTGRIITEVVPDAPYLAPWTMRPQRTDRARGGSDRSFSAPPWQTPKPRGSRRARVRRSHAEPAILRRLNQGEKPPQNIGWKDFSDNVRSDAGVTANKQGNFNQSGFSNERIEKLTREIMGQAAISLVK